MNREGGYRHEGREEMRVEKVLEKMIEREPTGKVTEKGIRGKKPICRVTGRRGVGIGQ